MGETHGRTTSTVIGDRRQEFVAVVEAILPEVTGRLENLAIYAMLAAFWGMILYAAMTAL